MPPNFSGVRTVRIQLVFLLVLSCLGSCTTEFNPNLVTDPTPVVYSIIHPQDSVYTVRLTKTFIGAGSAYQFAAIPDSIYYEGARVFLETRTPAGKLVESVEMEETEISERLPGIFARVPNRVFQTDTSALHIRQDYFESRGMKYDLVLHLRAEIPGLAEPVKASTPLRTIPRITEPRFTFLKVYFYSEEPYWMQWMDTNEESMFEILVRMRYREFLYDEERDQTAEWVLTGVDANVTSFPGGERKVYSYYFRPENFYSKIRSVIADDPEVEARVVRNVDFEILSTNREMEFYREIYEISDDYHGTGFSNIENGIGLFTTYSSAGIYGLLLGQTELDSLANGRYTRHLKFKNW